MTDISLSPEAVEVQAPPRFRKKPIEIQAVQWTGDNWEELLSFFGTARVSAGPSPDRPDVLEIDTLEGSMAAQPGDWIIREPFPTSDRQFYPCKPDIFAATYDIAPEPLELTPEERAAKAKHPHMSTCHDQDCQECVREIAANRRTIKAVRPVIEADARADERLALGAAGRLLPEGCSLRSDFRIRWFLATPDGGERVDEWGAGSLQSVRELLEERPANALRYTVTFCEHWTSQYVPVDPKALEPPDERSEGQRHG